MFDLDNTLYPQGSDLWPQIDQRITAYLMNYLGVDGLTAYALQKYWYERDGTSLRGLMRQYAIDVRDYLDFVHDIDRSNLARNQRLADAIAALPGRRLVLTNGSKMHAERTITQLGLDGLFERIFDIEAMELVPKPNSAAYEKFFAACAIEPSRAALFEDLAQNLIAPQSVGMVGVLVGPQGKGHSARAEGADFVTDDLAGFVARIVRVTRNSGT
ncbi:MAG: pyrimidine 5'-nucleotidase [Hyphomicrobiales bacterium]|nr:pyrimidine 5'-nucleotidase [Hyphomicrobiales bacterium]